MKKYFAVIIAIHLTCVTCYSFDSLKVKTTIWQDITGDVKVFVNDAVSYYSFPFRMSSTSWLYTGAGALSIAGLMTQDKYFKEKLSVGEKGKDVWYYSKQFGEVKYAGIGSAIIYFTGLFAREKSIRVTGRMLLESLFLSGSVTILLKTVFGRTRPYATESQYQFNWFETKDEKLGLPSGHSTIAFALSTVLAERINTWWSRAVFYSLAGLTSYSRVHDNQHWVTDVITGGLIGFGTGMFVVHNAGKTSGGKSVSLYPGFNTINLRYNF